MTMSARLASRRGAGRSRICTITHGLGEAQGAGAAMEERALDAGHLLSLAAAPTFAIMALLTGMLGSAQPDLLCASTQDAWPLSGMVPMYVLMSAFHLAPWLKLASGLAK